MNIYTLHNQTKNQQGFTLVETLVAIFILALTVGALLTLTAGGFFSIRYAKNDIIAANLLQESLEYVRNTRDSASQNAPSLPPGSQPWDSWLNQYSANGCFVTNGGCSINPYASESDRIVNECTGGDCPYLSYYPDVGLYAYDGYAGNLFDSSAPNGSVLTSFKRTITMEPLTVDGGPELIVTARMDWLNGTNPKHAEQSIVLTSWDLE